MEKQKIALILGDVNRGAIQTYLRTQNYYIYSKLLLSSVRNWEAICKLMENDINNRLIVLGKFTEYALFQMCLPEYEQVVDRLIRLLQNKKHILFIYKNNILGNFSSYNRSVEQKECEEIINDNPYIHSSHSLLSWLRYKGIDDSGKNYLHKIQKLICRMNNELNVLPYEKIIDVEISGQNFIEYLTEGLLFRIFVPNERIWSHEFDKFIILFKDYAANISNVKLKILQHRLDSGIICSLYSNEENITEGKLNSLFNEFSSFMDICASNPQEAIRIVSQLEDDKDIKTQIVQKYIKEAQRLMLDIKHEREQKIMSIKHRLENELQEYELSAELNSYVNNAISKPKFDNILLGGANEKQYDIRTEPIYIDHIDKIIYQEINGNISLSNEEETLIEIIEKYSSNLAELSALQTALFELKDKGTPKEHKRSAWQKLYGFLGKVSSKIGDVGIALLSKYLEQKLSL